MSPGTISKNNNILTLTVQSPTMKANSDNNFKENLIVSAVNENMSADRKLESEFGKLADLLVGKFDKLASSVTERLDNSTADVGNMRMDINNILSRVKNAEKTALEMNKTVAELKSKITTFDDDRVALISVQQQCDELKSKLCAFENERVASDVILHNVPDTADVVNVVNKSFDMLGCKSIKVKNAFRLRTEPNGKICSPIIIKLHSAHDRVNLFTALAKYRKSNKKPLCIEDVGGGGGTNVFMHECLSDTNRQIMKAALNLKFNKLLTTVYSMRGRVFVKIGEKQDAILITNLSELEAIAGERVN